MTSKRIHHMVTSKVTLASIEKELGHKVDGKYDKMFKNELRSDFAGLNEKD
jgi:hypothetical protein